MIENSIDSFKEQLSEKVKGLVFPSETDSSVEVIALDKNADITAFLKLRHPDQAEHITESGAADFYEMYAVQKEWQNEIQKQFARRFGDAIDFMKDNLENIRLFKLGQVRIDIYLIGVFKDKTPIGLKTQSVET